MSKPRFCKFTPGQIIYHRSYYYRGVIFDVDEECMADEEWYKSNQTQPNRKQPWYHVMVDGEFQITYVAEENIEPDPLPDSIDNPLVEQYFQGFEDGKYFRDYNA